MEFQKKVFNLNYFNAKVDLNGERIISSLKVWKPKFETPILAENRKNIDTKRIDRNVNVQDMGVKILTRFQAGDLCSGNFENQKFGIYRNPGAHTPIVPRP